MSAKPAADVSRARRPRQTRRAGRRRHRPRRSRIRCRRSIPTVEVARAGAAERASRRASATGSSSGSAASRSTQEAAWPTSSARPSCARREIADGRSRDAGGRALIVGGWVRDRLMGRDVEGRRPRGRSACRPTRCIPAAARSVRPRRERRRELPGLQARRHRRLAAAARVEVRPRPPRLRGHRRSVDVGRRGGAAARLHGQRDRVGSADRASISIRSTVAATSTDACCASSTRRRSPTTACACCAPSSSPPVSTSRSTTRRAALCRAIPLDDLPAERVWGEVEKLLFAPRPSIGFALALDLGIVAQAVPGAARARRMSAGAGVASGRRRLGAHAAGRRSGAHAASTIWRGRSRSPSCSAPSVTTSASRRRRRSSTAASARWITKNRASRRRCRSSIG